FDGRRITIRDNVSGEGPHDWVRANELVATLTRPVNFSRGADAGTIEVAEVACRGGVHLDHRTVDDRGQTSHERAKLETITINQQTGALSGAGPGWIRSVRLSDGSNPLEKIAGGQASDAAPAAESVSKLNLLELHFQGGVAGNLKSRRIEFQRRVRAVYGPVIAWEQQLPLTPRGAMAPDTATLSCDRLQVAEDPLGRFQPQTVAAPADGSRLGPLELIAQGGVQLEGAAEGGGSFNARAAQASYSQLKELFVLRGDSSSRATLWVQKAPGEGTLKHTSGKVSYWRKTGVVQTENFGATGYTPTAGRTQPAPR
ncbi:MAG: hypothetical protein AAF589_04885, partial [Planctomycetota bacterium]